MLVCRLLARSHGLWAILAIAGLLFCVGCSPGGYSGPVGTVTGTVTLNGEPVPAGCTVTFISDDGHAASGKVGPGGSYQLSAGAEGNNVPAATYKVSITPPGKADASEADYDKMMEAESAGEASQEETQPAEEVIPAKYQTTGTSGLSFEVKAGSNTIDVPLE
ncbi:MAG TPA: carboxypeptidase-like regulatory domain-containing protein [Thermoguttaceae bacterium]|nr:carboxypeptidase-like regulatory domain-containing protein [Thermoguttaceae bacterium]